MTWIIMIVIQNKIMCLYNNFARKPLWKYKKNINENKHSFYDKKNICTMVLKYNVLHVCVKCSTWKNAYRIV